MDIYFLHHSEYERLYNCSKINIDDLPLESRTHVGKSILTIFLTSILLSMYIPCTFALYRHRAHSCYKLMFYIAIIDLAVLPFLGFLHGYFGIKGAVFCTSPDFMFLCGIFTNTLWMTESSAQISLAINRCLAIVAPRAERALFGGKRVYIWLSAVTCYGLYVLIFSRPCLFTGLYYIWSYNPFVGYLKDTNGIYTNHLHTVHNTSVAIVIPSIYFIFVTFLLFKMRAIDRSTDKNFSRKQKLLFIQIFIIGFIHFAGCLIYAFSPYIAFNVNLLYLAQYLWFSAHAIPPVLYLTMNEVIRNDCLRALFSFYRDQFSLVFKESFLTSSAVQPVSTSLNAKSLAPKK